MNEHVGLGPLKNCLSIGSLVCRDTGEVVVEHLEVADNYWRRLVGLQFRRSLPPGDGLLLVPCSSIHTFWMRFAIDVLTLDKTGVVLEVRRAVKPWRIVACHRLTHAVLETAPTQSELPSGVRLKFIRNATGESRDQPSLRFLD
jgi:hypothetical protein